MPFHDDLKKLLDEYVHEVYRVTKKFPREELYGVTSQLRRATLSAVLNYIEGYARIKIKVHKNFIETSYGSLQESKYLIEFSHKEGYVTEEESILLMKMADRIGSMLWGMLKRM